MPPTQEVKGRDHSGGKEEGLTNTIAILTSEQKTNAAIACPTPQRDWVNTIQLWGCSTQADFCAGAPDSVGPAGEPSPALGRAVGTEPLILLVTDPGPRGSGV